MDDYPSLSPIQRRYELLKPVLDERLRRLWAAAEALALGTRGVAILSSATGLSRTTIRAGIEELRSSKEELMQVVKQGRVRRPGAGRKRVVERDVTLEADLKALLESFQAREGHALDWTCKSIRGLTDELAAKGHQVSYRSVGNLLHRMGFRFSPAENYKKFPLEHRREQFLRLSHCAGLFLEKDEPVVALSFTDQTRHQIVAPEARTAGLATSVLRHWWQENVRKLSRFRRMLLLLDTTGLPSGDRSLWAPLLRPMAEDAGVEIVVCHFPPGARRWRRSASGLTCSCSYPTTDGRDQRLAIDLDLILSPDSERPRRTTALHRLREPYKEPWIYRIDRIEERPRGSAG